MHKKLEAELVSLAHSILQMKNKDDVTALQKKALDIYEKLSVLKFVDEYINITPSVTAMKEVVLDKDEDVLVDDLNEIKPVTEIVEEVVSEEELASEEEVVEKAINEVEAEEIIHVKDDLEELLEEDSSAIQFTLEEEFKDAISADVATNLFEKATKENPIIDEPSETKTRSLNDALFINNIQVGLNDRIAFVNHLFEGNQEDFNRVLSQLNSFKSEEEARDFIHNLVKPDYDWSEKDEYEERLLNLIERKFM